MDRYIAISLIVLFAGTVVNCLEFEDERRSYDDEFQNWRNDHHLFGYEGVHPKSATRRTAEDSSSSEEHFTHGPSMDVDVISGSIGGSDGGEVEIETHPRPGSPDFNGSNGDPTDVIFHHQSLNPFFNNPFLNIFGFGESGFPAFGRPQSVPWWKGPNVCTERKEELEDWDSSSKESDEVKSLQDSQTTSTHFGIHVSLNTCIEKPHKHVCKTIVNERGRKKTISVVHQCCHGYGRRKSSENSNVIMPCEKIDLQPVLETSEKLGGKEFIRSAQKNSIESNLQKNVTLFLPIDAAFTEFAEQMLESNLVVLPLSSRSRRSSKDVSGITTKEIILSHIVPGWVNIEDIENEQLLVSEYENSTIRMNIFPRPPGSHDDDYSYNYRYTANCAPITKVNQEAENGIVHVIDRVLTPVTKSLMDIIRDRSDMAVLQTVLEKTNLSKVLENSEKTFTLFAPTDKAFEKLDPHLRRTIKDGKGCALNILKNHILDMTFCSVAVVSDAKTSAINTLGEKMNLERIDSAKSSRSETASEVEDLTGAKSILINGEARILETDIMATNGVLHVVDTLLPTESGMPVTSLLDSRNLTIFKKLIELNGFDDQLDSYENVSIFAPTDLALSENYWAKKIETEPEKLKNNEELRAFLKYHIAKPLTRTCDLSERSLDTELGPSVRINLYSTHTIFSNIMNRATVNCARLVHFDDDSCGSVLHQVDRVLEPPTQNILEILENNEEYSMFLDLIKGANLTDLLKSANNSLTILVPKNDIFIEVKEFYDELKQNNNKQLEDAIKTHIIDDVLCCAGIMKSEWPFIRIVKTINNYDLKLGRDRRPTIQNAGVTKCDIIAKNGIIHEINDVINAKHTSQTDIGHNDYPWTRNIRRRLNGLSGLSNLF